jgi:VanZ family protein
MRSRPHALRRAGKGEFLKPEKLDRLRVWLPVILAGLLVCLAGTDQLSWANTAGLTRPFFEWLYPEGSTWDITVLTWEVRKLAHVALYGFVAILIVRVLVVEARLKAVKASLATLVIVLLAAIIDETHQSMIPTRSGSMAGVVLDLVGAGGGLLYYWWMKWVMRFFGVENGAAPRVSLRT